MPQLLPVLLVWSAPHLLQRLLHVVVLLAHCLKALLLVCADWPVTAAAVE